MLTLRSLESGHLAPEITNLGFLAYVIRKGSPGIASAVLNNWKWKKASGRIRQSPGCKRQMKFQHVDRRVMANSFKFRSTHGLMLPRSCVCCFWACRAHEKSKKSCMARATEKKTFLKH